MLNVNSKKKLAISGDILENLNKCLTRTLQSFLRWPMLVHLNCKYLVVMEITKFKKEAIMMPVFRNKKWHDLENFAVKLSYKSI